MMRHFAFTARSFVISATFVALACSKGDESANSTAGTPEPSSGTPVAAPAAAGTRQRANSVRGRLVSVSDTMLTVSSRGSEVRVRITQPLEVYSRVPAQLSQVKENSYVGITSQPQPDGNYRATEIHIFPEKLRGMNEGSFPMGAPGGGAPAGGNTMTNGTVSGSQMTNGTVAGGGNRMTNGTVAGGGNTMTNGTVGTQSGNNLTVRFQSQTITIPSNVRVTAIALTKTKLAPGMSVVIPATPGPDGTPQASIVMLSPAGAGGRRR